MKQEFDDLGVVKQEFDDLGNVKEEYDDHFIVKEELEDSDDETVLNEDVGISHIIDVLANEPILPSSPREDQTSPATDEVYDPDTGDEALSDPYQ